MKQIVNGAPGVVDYGVQDLSGAPYTRAPVQLPQHLAKHFIFAQKGPTEETLAAGADRNQIYGTTTFMERSPYFNHATKHSNGMNAEGNLGMYVRLIPTDAGPKPTICMSVDVLPVVVDLYERNEDGSIKTTLGGDPVVVGTTPGYRIKFIAKQLAGTEDFGGRDIGPGTQSDPASGTQSKIYPLFDMEHSFIGGDGNLAGIRIWPQNEENTVQLPQRMMSREKAYPFNFAVVRKDAVTSTASPVKTIFQEDMITVVLKPGVIDPLSNSRLYFGDRVVKNYQSLDDLRYVKQYGEFGKVKVYQDNIDLLLGLFHESEKVHLVPESDMTEDVGTKYLFNLFTLADTRNSPYHSVIFTDNSTDGIRFSQMSTVYAMGGSDGTMSMEMHANLVSQYMKRYANPNDELNDIAYHVESHIYDSGYPLDTKYELINFIAHRKDTYTVLATGEWGQRDLTQAEEQSVAAALMSALSLHPESTYFNTPIYRASILGHMGRVRLSAYEEKWPLTYELGVKSARYMGAANGSWKSGLNFDGDPGSVVETQFDITNPWTPDSVRNRLWDAGLTWVSRMDRESFYFPCVRTVFSDDTSILTSYITACAVAWLNKAAHEVHRRMSGVSGLTAAQFSQKVNDKFNDLVRGRFDNRFRIIPRCQFTSLDEALNYSWTFPVDFYGPGMKTVMTTYVTTRRIEQYTGE